MAIDFDFDGDDYPIQAGTYLDDEYKAFGLCFFAMARIRPSTGVGFTPFNAPRVFDSSNPSTGDEDLGSPNGACPTGGPGLGTEGQPGSTGENCVPLGNVLIIQDAANQAPDDFEGGGFISMGFTKPVPEVFQLTLLDVEPGNLGTTYVIVGSENDQGNIDYTMIVFQGLGDNALQTIDLVGIDDEFLKNVVSISFFYPYTGAIVDLSYCRSAETHPTTKNQRRNLQETDETMDDWQKEMMWVLEQPINEGLHTFEERHGIKAVMQEAHNSYSSTKKNQATGDATSNEQQDESHNEPVSSSNTESSTGTAAQTLTIPENPDELDCETESKKIDVLNVKVDKCAAAPATDDPPIRILSQDEDSVKIAVSQVWKGCDSSGSELAWLAVDYVSLDDRLACDRFDKVPCGVTSIVEAKCHDGAAVIDLYQHDKNSGMFFQEDESAIDVPEACGGKGDTRQMCQSRFIVKCKPSQCRNAKTPPTRRFGIRDGI